MPKGTRENPFELRPGATDRFYAVFGAGFLATGDAIATASWSCPSSGATLSAEQVNSTPLTLDGVEYAANEVASVNASGVALNDLVEIICDYTTTAGRIDKQSVWLCGVPNYS